MPLAPLPEQQRIADKLDSLLSRVDSCRERLDRVPSILKRFRQSVLAAATSGKLTEDWREENPPTQTGTQMLEEIAQTRVARGFKTRGNEVAEEGIAIPETSLPKSWTWCRVWQIADVRLGGTPSRRKPEYWNGEIAWVSSGEVSNCRISKTKETITKLGHEESNAKLYPVGTVLIAMIGEGKTRGQSAILEVEATTNQNSAGLVFDVPIVNPEYVWIWALSEYEKTRSVGRGGNQPALNGAKVRALPVPFPPRNEQAEIVRRVTDLLSIADNFERRYRVGKDRVDRLTPSLLAKAFRGELVPQDPNDEPASVLLERIRAAKPDTKKKASRRKAKAK